MFEFEKLSYLNPASGLKAGFKLANEDFQVDEMMPVVPEGEGEHCWLHIRKKGANTEYVAKQLASFSGIKQSAVSYAGLKDRNAVTTQWFSLHMPGMADPDWDLFSDPEIKILESQRHTRKLKRGALTGNQFKIRLTSCEGDKEQWITRLQLIKDNGVPNYFGRQRFGHQMNNLHRSLDLVQHNKLRRLKPHKRGIFLSSMRSWIFNRIVSERIRNDFFNQPQAGDVFMLAESQACFTEQLNDEILQRLENKSLHLTAALWGRGKSMATEQVEKFECDVASEYPVFIKGLELAGLKQERRAMRLMPVNMQWQFDADNSLVVSFELTKGSYATAVLRELGDIEDVSMPNVE